MGRHRYTEFLAITRFQTVQHDIYIREKLHNRIRNYKSIMREREQKMKNYTIERLTMTFDGITYWVFRLKHHLFKDQWADRCKVYAMKGV